MSNLPTPEEVALTGEIASRVRETVPQDRVTQIRATDWSLAEIIDRGKDHRVLVSDNFVARLARGDLRGTQTQALGSQQRRVDVARVSRLVDQLDTLIPWHLPVALTEADNRGVIQPRIAGAAHPRGTGNRKVLADILRIFENVPVKGLELAVPFEQRGGLDTQQAEELAEQLATDDLTARALPLNALSNIVKATQEFTYRPQVPHGLVHGDLAGYNMLWHEDTLQGIIDWDYATCWDTALNVTYLGLWHGIDLIDAIATDEYQARRARIWLGAHAMESLNHAASRQIPVKSWRRLVRKTAPRIHAAVDALNRQRRVR